MSGAASPLCMDTLCEARPKLDHTTVIGIFGRRSCVRVCVFGCLHTTFNFLHAVACMYLNKKVRQEREKTVELLHEKSFFHFFWLRS